MVKKQHKKRSGSEPASNRSRLHAPRILGIGALISALIAPGCLQRDDPLTYPFHDEHVQYYKDVAQETAYPAVVSETPQEIAFSKAPHTILSRDLGQPWDMTVAEAVLLALQNNDVIRSFSDVQFETAVGRSLANVNNINSIYDPAINESGVLFGGRSVEAALSAFDTNFTTSMIWGRDEQVQNNIFFGGGLMPGATLIRETGNFQSGLRKDFSFGGQIQLNHTVNYLGANATQLFPSTYTGLVQALYRQPLWAGAGTEYTRIAGPITQQFGGLSGVTQGVVIARINNDISIADFQANIRDLVKEVQDAYWFLYLTYRDFDTAVTARNAALAEWRRIKLILREGGVGAAPGVRPVEPRDESQARDAYFFAEAEVERTRTDIFRRETQLRDLLALPVSDDRVIRPVDEPITAELVPDWQVSLTEALMNRVEVRQIKWQIKSLELQLQAARSLTRPRLDFVGGYQVNAFGDDLLGYNDNDDAGTAQGLDNYFESLTQGNQTGWSLGFEFTMPIGFRSALAQVRNIELRLAKAQRVLHAQEMIIAHQLAVTFQELAGHYAQAQTNYNRRKAAIDNVETVTIIVENGAGTADEVLRAQQRRAAAESAFFRSIVTYNQILTKLQFVKGTLLQDTNVTILENGWDPDAYVDAYRRAQARSAAIDAPFKYTAPEEFASHVPVGEVYFAEPLPPTHPEDGIIPATDDPVAPMSLPQEADQPSESSPSPSENEAPSPADDFDNPLTDTPPFPSPAGPGASQRRSDKRWWLEDPPNPAQLEPIPKNPATREPAPVHTERSSVSGSIPDGRWPIDMAGVKNAEEWAISGHDLTLRDAGAQNLTNSEREIDADDRSAEDTNIAPIGFWRSID